MKRFAFTLVELLIVVIILGILAAVVIPQFSDASTDTRVSSLQTNLTTIRQQLELWKLQHVTGAGPYPKLSTFSDQMTKKTDLDGTVNNASGKYGPYMQSVPNNPFTDPVDNTVGNAGTPAKNLAWYYDETTGTFKANDSSAHNAY